MAALLVSVATCGGSTTAPQGTTLPGADTLRVALTDMGTRTYYGLSGGLYPDHSNTMPAAHRAAAITRALRVQARDAAGNPLPAGKYILLSIGLSNTTQEFSAFQPLAAADAAVNHTQLVIVDGAAGGKTAPMWAAPTSVEYDRVRDTRLVPLGLSEAQVAAVWLKVANSTPTRHLPATDADATTLAQQLSDIARALRTRYPNLQMVFISSRIYAGYATSTLNPEPYAYESGFSVKRVVQAQIDQMAQGNSIVDAMEGNLAYDTAAPWIAWGPYLWADGLTARSDGLTWAPSDLGPDGTHPSDAGRAKVASMLLDFFKTQPMTRCWFLVSATCQ
jgi:lysophospholipase L1-like esterase